MRYFILIIWPIFLLSCHMGRENLKYSVRIENKTPNPVYVHKTKLIESESSKGLENVGGVVVHGGYGATMSPYLDLPKKVVNLKWDINTTGQTIEYAVSIEYPWDFFEGKIHPRITFVILPDGSKAVVEYSAYAMNSDKRVKLNQ